MSSCNSTGAFYAIEKQKVFKIVKSSHHFQETLAQLDKSFDFKENLFQVLQELVDQFYDVKSYSSISDAHYRNFCSKSKVPKQQKLPPIEDELL